MKIVFLTKVKAFAGSERHLVEIISALDKKSFDCSLIIVVEKKHDPSLGNFYNTLNENSIKWRKIIIKKFISVYGIIKLLRIIKSQSPDIIHAHLIHAEFWASILKIFSRSDFKLVSSIHSFDEKYQSLYGYDYKNVKRTLYYWTCRFNSRFVDKYIAVSNSLKNFYVRSGIAPITKIQVILHGIKVNSIQVDKNPYSGEFTTMILVPGRIVQYKGQEFVIRTLPVLKTKFPDLKVIFIGDQQGEYANSIKKLTKTLLVEEMCLFKGHVTDIDNYISCADLVIVPSRVEGFGLVVIESFRLAKTVIAFDVPAINELIIHKKTGILVKAFDIKSLSDEISEILSNKALRNKIGENARQSLTDDFNFEKMIRLTSELYISLNAI